MFKVFVENKSGTQKWFTSNFIENTGYRITIKGEWETLEYKKDEKTGVYKTKYGAELGLLIIDGVITFRLEEKDV